MTDRIESSVNNFSRVIELKDQGADLLNSRDYDKATTVYSEVIALCDTIVEESAYSTIKANAHECLGDIYSIKDKRNKARKHYIKAIAIYEQLLHEADEDYKSHLVSCYEKLGKLERVHRIKDALHIYERLLDLYNSIKEDTPSDTNELSVAYAHFKLSTVQAKAKRFKEAKENAAIAAATYEAKSKTKLSPEILECLVATYSLLSAITHDGEKSENAHIYLSKAASVIEEYSALNLSSTERKEIVKLYGILAETAKHNGDKASALQFYRMSKSGDELYCANSFRSRVDSLLWLLNDKVFWVILFYCLVVSVGAELVVGGANTHTFFFGVPGGKEDYYRLLIMGLLPPVLHYVYVIVKWSKAVKKSQAKK